MRKFRKMTWFLLGESALFLVWMIAGGSSGASSAAKDCATDPSVTGGILTKQECIDASNVGTGIGVVLIFVLWFMVTVVGLLVWLGTRPRKAAAEATS